MTRTSKVIKCSIGSGKKGTLVIHKSSLSLRRHRVATLTAARAAKKKEVEEIIDDRLTVISDLTPQTAYSRSTTSTNASISSTTLSFNTSIIERGRYRKRGSSLEEFMEGNLDWRSFGSITYDEMKEVGLFDRIKKKISIYNNARTNKAKHKSQQDARNFASMQVLT
jgi:hypothetical protein